MAETAPAGLNALTTRLLARYGHVLPESVIKRVIEESFASLQSGARISAYLPVLAERAASKRLVDLVRRAHHTVEFRGEARQWQAAVAAAADDRWQIVDQTADVVVVTPVDQWSSIEVTVIADARDNPPPQEVVAAYENGATAYVCGARPLLLLAHLDAIARRHIIEAAAFLDSTETKAPLFR